jgi:hypothetical protein
MKEEPAMPTATVDSSKSPAGSLKALLLLNAALLVLLGAVTFGSTALAQNRGRGEYTMVAGGVNGANSSAAYIVDVANQEMIALTYDHNTKLLQGVGYRNLNEDAVNRTKPARPAN